MALAEDRWNAFDSEFDRFAWLLSALKGATADMKVTKLTDANLELFVVASAWFRQALSFGEALEALGFTDRTEAAGPTIRALYELWGEFQYLMGLPDANSQAIRVQIAALLELDDWLQKVDRDFPAEGLAGLKRQKEFFAKEYSAMYEEIVSSRKQRRYHWSGLSRTEVLRRAFDAGAANVYSAFSWEVHSTMTALRDVSVDRANNSIFFSHYLDESVAKEQMAHRAGGMLFFMWHQYSAAFGLPLVEPP